MCRWEQQSSSPLTPTVHRPVKENPAAMDLDDQESVMSDSGSSMSGTTAPSLYSYSSSRDGNALLRSIEGRLFNNQNELYFLPAGVVPIDYFCRCITVFRSINAID